MAPSSVVARTLLLTLVLAQFHLSTCRLVKGSVSCLDCSSHYSLSGVAVAVRCSHDNRLASALTNSKGYFEVEIPSDSLPPLDCMASLLGGPEQLCSSKKTMVSKIIQARGSNSYVLSTPLSFFTSCPSKAQQPRFEKPVGGRRNPDFEASKPINFTEWGLPPLSYYFRFLPIIGIP